MAEPHNIESEHRLIDPGEKALIKPELVDLIQSRVNNNFMKDSSGNCSKSNNTHVRSQKMPTLNKPPFVIEKQNPKNSLTKSKAQYDKIRAFILLEKYAKNIGEGSKEICVPRKESE